MAKNTSNEELRAQALASIAEGRAEISAEVHRLRNHLSPAQVIRRAFDRHTTVVIILAFTAAAIPALFIFRSKPSAGSARRAGIAPVTPPPPKPVLGALLMGALGLFVKTIMPALIKSSIVPHVLGYLSSKESSANGGRRQSLRDR